MSRMFAEASRTGGNEEDLRRRLAFAEAVTRATPDCLYIFDLEANEFRYQNVTVQEFLGYDDEALAAVEGDFYEWVGHPDERDIALQSIDAHRRMRIGDHTDRTYRLRGGDGQYRWYSLRVVAFSGDGGDGP